MSLVGKKFPNITVDAMSEMGDNLRINILEEATKKNKNSSGILRILPLFVLQSYTLLRNFVESSRSATQSS